MVLRSSYHGISWMQKLKSPLLEIHNPQPPWLGLCNNMLTTGRNTKATLKCYHALHSYVGTVFGHDKLHA